MKTVEQTFEVAGYFEEIIDVTFETAKCLGTRRVESRGCRPLGFAGRKEFTITEPIWLQRGYKAVKVSGSEKKPRRCISYLQAICGPSI